MLINITLGIFLVICCITDIKFREINPKVLAVFALAGAVLFMICQPVSIFEEAIGLLIGIVFIALWAVTDEKVGLGDGLMMLVTGIYLGGRENSFLIMTAMLLSAVYSIYFLVIKKADRNMKFPFAPFILTAFVLRQALDLWRFV